jgi:acetolactate synthase I/II/III large subunit
MAKKSHSNVGRRSFLAGIGAAGAAGAALSTTEPAAAEPIAAKPALPPPWVANELAAVDTAQIEVSPGPDDGLHIYNPGSDYMIDVMRELGHEYVIAMPGSTFRGLQESVAGYALNKNPEWITCVHEELSAGIAHGYYKASGKVASLMVHNDVGLQHASMGIYNAWADRVPMTIIAGNYADVALRSLGADWDHSMTDVAAIVRGMIKYDDQPASLMHFYESMARGYGLAITPPMGPFLIVADGQLQEEPITGGKPPMRKFVAPLPPVADQNAIAEIAQMLVAANNPVIVVDRSVRSQNDVALLVRLAELLQAPVNDRGSRMNFPTNHYLWAPGSVVADADVILALDVGNLFGLFGNVADTLPRRTTMRVKDGTKVISIDSQLLAPAANYQDKQRFFQADLPVAGDAAATLPSLVEAVDRAMTTARRNANPQRADKWRAAFAARRRADITAAAVGWDDSPITVPRVCMEIYNQIKTLDWTLTSPTGFQSDWPQRLWDFTSYHNYLGNAGADGVGYQGPAAVGAALAHRSDGIISVNIQGDGDFMVGPGVQWTASHHKLPLLTIIHNNRAWHNETMKIQVLASRRDRHPEMGRIGTVITDPNIDYKKVAEGFGVYAEGPISNPSDLAPALARALKVVKSGNPALLDVVMQPR